MAKNMFKLIDGIETEEGLYFFVDYDDEEVRLNRVKPALARVKTDQTYRIPLKNIIDLRIVTKKEVEEKNKSVVARGLTGGFLFGPVGLFLGGLSGTGKKGKNKYNAIFVISYLSSNDSETIRSIVFDASVGNWQMTNSSYVKKLQKMLKNVEPSKDVMAIRNSDGSITL